MSETKVTIEVRMQPGAKSNEIIRLEDGVLNVKVKALPRKGEANRALLGLIARALSVPADSVDIIIGRTSRSKVITIKGISAGEIRERLDHILVEKGHLL